MRITPGQIIAGAILGLIIVSWIKGRVTGEYIL